MKASFVACMKDYFGLLPGQTSVDFLKEIRALSPEDRKYFTPLLATVGREVIEAAA